MQALCQYDVQGGKVNDALAALGGGEFVEPGAMGYARTLCEHYQLAGADIDARIATVLRDRNIDRVDAVARNVARVATIELIRAEVPPKVAINEAIEIAREFACDETAKFVNGLLDPLIEKTAKDA